MFKFITSRPLWINIAFALGAVLILVLLFILSLNWITKHGESLTVPAVIGKNINDAEKMLDDKGFEVVVQDSVYYDSLPPGLIIRQIPEADNVVKINRTVYVTINRFVAPDVDMPNLLGSSFRNAEMILKNIGLKMGDTTYRFDFAKNSVLEQLVNGQPIKAGTKIRMGSRISLVLGSGLGNEDQAVPDLRGLTLEEARAMLDASGITLGVALPDPNVQDTATAFVYRQTPMPQTEDGAKIRIRPGQMIDIWLGVSRPNVDSLRKVEQTSRSSQNSGSEDQY
jgi:beta-lactam-binding protein with PASTA domain